MVNAQQWLEQTYPSKEQVNIIEIAEEAEGELTISNFPQLVEIKKKTEGKKNITKLIINNCILLQRINCYFCWELKELVINGCPQITELNCDTNRIESLDLSELTALTRLNCSNNRLTNLDISNNQQLSHLACEKNKIKKLDLGKNPALTFLDINGNPLEHSPHFFTKKRKNELKKLRESLVWSEQILAQTFEENEEKVTNLENRIKDLKISLAEEQKVLIQEQIKSHDFQQNIDSLQEKVRIDGRTIIKLEWENKILKQQLICKEIQEKHYQLEQSVNILKRQLNEDDKDELDTLLEAQEELINNNNAYVEKQVEKVKKKLVDKKIKIERLEQLLQMQRGLIDLQKELEVINENKIEVPAK